MRYLLTVLASVLVFSTNTAIALADFGGDAAKFVAAIKCPEPKEKTAATTAVPAAPYAAVGKQCGSAAWIVVVKHAASGWVKVNDTLTNAGTPNPLAMPGVPRDIADALWGQWQKWGAGQNSTPGTHADRAAVKALAAQPGVKITKVNVVGDWAMLVWIESESGGEQLWHRLGGKWQIVTGGGGAMDPIMVSAFGVPYSIAQKLMPH